MQNYVKLVEELQELDRREAQRLADYQFQRNKIVTDLKQAIEVSTAMPATAAAPANGNGGNGRRRGEREGPTTKQHILNVLNRSRTGLPLTGIVTEMTRMKERGEWKTDTKDVTSVVSQAMNGLRKDKYVKVEKNTETNKNVYSVIPQPAAV